MKMKNEKWETFIFPFEEISHEPRGIFFRAILPHPGPLPKERGNNRPVL
jgi:hypothetical protein